MIDLDLLPGVMHRGLGIVARWPGVVVVIPSDPAHDAAAEELVTALGPEPQPAEVVRLIRDEIGAGRLRSVGLLLAATGGPLGMVYGTVEIVADGDLLLSGAGGLAEEQVVATERLTLRAANLAKAAEAVAPFDLRRGVVPGAGISLGVAVSALLASPPVAPPRPDERYEADPEPYEVEIPFRSQSLLGLPAPIDVEPPLPVATSAPAGGVIEQPERPVAPPSMPDAPIRPDQPPVAPPPVTPASAPAGSGEPEQVMVNGIMCSRGHFNNPDAQFCWNCGINMVHVTHNLVPGPRPTLGFVVFDDGSTFGLNRSYLVGREPGEPADPLMAPLTIQDNNETLSRRHAEIRLVEWTVQLVDLNSTNGSFIWDFSMEHWNQIAPNQPVKLVPGDTVALGRRTFKFESVTRR